MGSFKSFGGVVMCVMYVGGGLEVNLEGGMGYILGCMCVGLGGGIFGRLEVELWLL